jgi:hypothetical protein
LTHLPHGPAQFPHRPSVTLFADRVFHDHCRYHFPFADLILTELKYQSTHQGTLIDAWHVLNSGDSDEYKVVEKFQYGYNNETCLVRRTKSRGRKQTKKIAKKKKRGTQRKLWLRKGGQCSDSSLRSFFLKIGLSFTIPFMCVSCCLISLLCAMKDKTTAASSANPPADPVPQTAPQRGEYSRPKEEEPEDEHSRSTIIEVEMPESGTV